MKMINFHTDFIEIVLFLLAQQYKMTIAFRLVHTYFKSMYLFIIPVNVIEMLTTFEII